MPWILCIRHCVNTNVGHIPGNKMRRHENVKGNGAYWTGCQVQGDGGQWDMEEMKRLRLSII